MKTIKLLSLLFAFIFVTSCDKDDDNPDVINEEETITTITVTLTDPSSNVITLQSQDLDGDGPNDPVVTVSGNLAGNTTYSGAVEFLNETESPAEDITEEVEEEADEHQVIYTTSGSIQSVATTDTDGNGDALGLAFNLTTNTAGDARITVTLRHEPTKPNDGTLSGAGGETDATATFSVLITE